jgi:hypothetical protein
MISDRGKSLVGTVLAVVSVSAFVASRESTTQILGRQSTLSLTSFISLGPLAGWILATRQGAILSALWSLIPATVFSVGPLLFWLSTRRTAWLIIATLMWLAAGYYYSVVIWV